MKLSYVALGLTLFGLILLSISLQFHQIRELELSYGSVCESEGVFQITGQISRVEITDTSTQFTIDRITPISVVVFDPDVYVQEDEFVTIVGRIDEFNGQKQFIASSIRSVTS